MRYRLRTLMIVLAIGPMVLVCTFYVACFVWHVVHNGFDFMPDRGAVFTTR